MYTLVLLDWELDRGKRNARVLQKRPSYINEGSRVASVTLQTNKGFFLFQPKPRRHRLRRIQLCPRNKSSMFFCVMTINYEERCTNPSSDPIRYLCQVPPVQKEGEGVATVGQDWSPIMLTLRRIKRYTGKPRSLILTSTDTISAEFPLHAQ